MIRTHRRSPESDRRPATSALRLATPGATKSQPPSRQDAGTSLGNQPQRNEVLPRVSPTGTTDPNRAQATSRQRLPKPIRAATFSPPQRPTPAGVHSPLLSGLLLPGTLSSGSLAQAPSSARLDDLGGP